MENYEYKKTLGDGSFGTVTLNVDKQSNELVAVKSMKQKYSNWEECCKLKEIQALKVLKHENIVQLKEMIRQQSKLNLIFEYMNKDLLGLMKEQTSQSLPEAAIRAIMHQTVCGLAFMHQKGFFHRDLKPENLLVKGEKVKLADFGLAREIRSLPPYTDYVSTRWYRAPECVLKSTNYSAPIDIWALGAIMIELYTFKPIFNGNTEKELFYKMCSVLSTPSQFEWQEGHSLASKINFKFPSFERNTLNSVLSGASLDAVDLIGKMLKWNPSERLTAVEVLNHPYFTKYPVNYSVLNEINNSFNSSSSDFDFKSRPKFKRQESKIGEDEQIDLNQSGVLISNRGHESA